MLTPSPETLTYVKKTVIEWLNTVDYGEDLFYVPDEFALEFLNFIKMVNGDAGEEHSSPVTHLRMLDNVHGPDQKILNMCSRGLAKSLPLTNYVYTNKGTVTIGALKVGDRIFGEDGKLTTVTHKSEVFHSPMYKLFLADGRELTVSEDHINTVIHKRKVRYGGRSGYCVSEYQRRNLTTKELLSYVVTSKRLRTSKNPSGYEVNFWVPNCQAIQYTEKRLPLDPYTLGLILGDGSSDRVTGFVRLHGHVDDMPFYKKNIPYELGQTYVDKRNPNVITQSIKGIGPICKQLSINVHGSHKQIPPYYICSSIDQRLALLQGLMDTDGTCYKNGGVAFTSNSGMLAKNVRDLVRSLGGIAQITPMNSAFRVNIKCNFSVFRLPRKADRQHIKSVEKVGILDIQPEATVPSQCIMVDNESHTFITNDYTTTHNTTLMGEYLFLYIGVYGQIPGFGKVNLALYVSDSIENGVKNMRKNLEFRWENSAFLRKYIPETHFTDIRWEFINADGRAFVVKGYGAKALALDSLLYTKVGYTTIGNCVIGDQIYGPDGKLTTIVQKSEIFHKPMYRLVLSDGRSIKVSEDHINSVVINTDPNNTVRWIELNLTTKELLQRPLTHTKRGNLKHKGISNKNLVFVKNTKALEYTKKPFIVDPYTLGVVLGDGRIQNPSCSVELTTHIDDLPTYQQHIPYTFGKGRYDKRNPNTWTQSIRGLGPALRSMELGVHGSEKFIPELYFFGSIDQRLALLQGLMDTDGTVTNTGRTSFCSCSPRLLADVERLARSLGATASRNKKTFCIEIWLNLPLFKLERKLNRQRFDRKAEQVAVVSIDHIADEPSQCIAVDNEDHQFLTGEYFRTHNTGVRGAKEMGVRPQLAVLDDLISDEDARSETVIKSIENTVNKAVNFALHPTHSKIIWSGTPFNARDPLYKAVESGAWKVNVFPVCNQFPCTETDFRGAWPSRFPYSYVKKQYDFSLAQGKIADFNQELMLRIMSDEDRLILDGDILWYNRSNLLANKSKFNYYITTDFATSEKQSADFSVIAVWALNSKGFWFLVDGICKRQTMDKNIESLFMFAQIYNPQSVGVEISGQQGGFIPWIMSQMMDRNCYFNIASDGNSNAPGINPNTNKMVRFNIVVPWFKSHIIFFPLELKHTAFIQEYLSELQLVSPAGFKSKNDDCLDTISMLSSLRIWRPSEEAVMTKVKDDMWEIEKEIVDESALSSYVV